MNLMIELDGETVPLARCDYVLWAPCGCPSGVTVAGAHRDEPCVTEDDAWRIFYSLKRDRDRKQHAGFRMELMTHERYCREVYPLMRQRECPHKQSGAA